MQGRNEEDKAEKRGRVKWWISLNASEFRIFSVQRGMLRLFGEGSNNGIWGSNSEGKKWRSEAGRVFSNLG